MIQLSSRASPGGSSALRTSCTRRSEFVTVPSASAHEADPGSTTSAILAVSVSTMSCTIRQSRSASSLRVCCTSASDRAGFSPITYSVLSSPRSIASNMLVRCQPYLGTIVVSQASSNFARAASSFSMSWKPGSLFGIAPMSPPPCTLFWPRSGFSPEPYRPTCPVSSAWLISASTLSTALWCSVIPSVQQMIARSARA